MPHSTEHADIRAFKESLAYLCDSGKYRSGGITALTLQKAQMFRGIVYYIATNDEKYTTSTKIFLTNILGMLKHVDRIEESDFDELILPMILPMALEYCDMKVEKYSKLLKKHIRSLLRHMEGPDFTEGSNDSLSFPTLSR